MFFFFFSSRRRHTRFSRDWSSDVCSSDLTGGLDDLGGLDIDAALVGHLGQLVALRDPATWHRLTNPRDTVDIRERRAFWADVRAAKEMLSRTASAPVHLPRSPEAIHLTREELERVAGP